MLRKFAWYLWLLMIAVLVLALTLRGYITSTFFSAELPPQLPMQIVLGYVAVLFLLTFVNFYFLFHQPTRIVRRR